MTKAPAEIVRSLAKMTPAQKKARNKLIESGVPIREATRRVLGKTVTETTGRLRSPFWRGFGETDPGIGVPVLEEDAPAEIPAVPAKSLSELAEMDQDAFDAYGTAALMARLNAVAGSYRPARSIGTAAGG